MEKRPLNQDYIYLCDWVDDRLRRRITCYVHPYIYHTSNLYELVLDMLYETTRLNAITDINYSTNRYDPYVSDDEQEAAREAWHDDSRCAYELVMEDGEVAV